MKRHNWKITIPISTLVILAAIGFGLFFLGKFFAEDILRELVSRESKGYYQLNFERLELNLLEKRITIHQLSLSPDTTKNFAELGLRNLYEIQLGQLMIDFESIYGFYFDKELDISNVRIVDPYINMVKLKTDSKTKFSLEAGDLYQSISNYLKVLKIDYFHIQDGALDYAQKDFSLGNIDFIVSNLLMDSTGRQNNVFYSEAIELEIRNQKFNLPDGIHTITFERFLLSTKDSVLTFKNFQLMPTPESGVTFQGNNDINVYHIQVPELSLRGIDYVAAYQENKLRIEELFLKEPTVYLDDESHGDQEAKEGDNSIMALLFNVFSSLEVGRLIIDQAHIDLKLDGQKNYQRLKAKETNIQFHEIRIDSSNYRFHSRHEYFKDLVLDIHNYQYFLPDSVHVAVFDQLRINTIREELLLHNLKISPKLAHSSDYPTVDMFIPALGIHGMDYRMAVMDRQLVADTISVAITLLESTREGKKKNTPFEIRSFYRMINPLFESVDVSRLLVRGRKLDPSEAVHLGSLDVNIRKLSLNRRTKSWKQLIGQMNLQVEDFRLKQDSISLNGRALSGGLDGLRLSDWRIDLNTSMQKIKGSVAELRISGVTIDSVMNGRANYFTRAELVRPVVEFDIKSGGGKGGFEDHIEKEVLITDASLKGKYDDWTISIGNLNTDVFEGDSTAFRRLDSRNIKIRNDSLNHSISLSRWNYDTLGGEMDFHDLRIKPLRKDSSSALVDVAVDFIGLKDFEQAKFFRRNELILSQLRVTNPVLNLYLKQDSARKSSGSQGAFTADISKVMLDSMDIIVGGLIGLGSLDLKNTSIQLDQFDFPGDLISTTKFLYSDQAEITIDRVNPSLNGNLLTQIAGLKFHSTDRSLELDTVNLTTTDGSMSSILSKLRLTQLDLNAFQEGGAIIANEIKIQSVTGESRVGGGNQSNQPFSYTKTLSIGKLDIPDIRWTVRHQNREEPFQIRDGYLKVSGISSEDTLNIHNLTERIEQLRFGGRQLDLGLNQGYSLVVGQYELNHPDHSINLKDITLKSAYSKEEFSTVIDNQTDWFDVSLEEVMIRPAGISSMISGDLFRIGFMDLKGLDATIYRDKAVPVTEQKMRPLLHADLQKLSLPLHIDSLHVSGDLVYQEKVEESESPGEMSFNNLDLSLTNVKSGPKGKNEIMTLRANGDLMNAGRFETVTRFQLNHPHNRFVLSGSLSAFPLNSLDRMLVPVAHVSVIKGQAEELDFNFVGNDTLAQGEMRFRYDDLRIRILNAKAHEKGRFGGGIKSFFANTFVVKRKNPSFIFLRQGTIFHHRDSTKGIFNYWAKALLSGSVSSIGIHKSDKAEKKFQKDLDARKEEDDLSN